jgi:acyl-CoA synthetase (AMP-forming)/AMP-acid ligase II
MLLGDVRRAAADRLPGKPALLFGSRELTHGKLEEQSDRLAGAPHGADIVQGDRVALLFGKRLERLRRGLQARALPKRGGWDGR